MFRLNSVQNHWFYDVFVKQVEQPLVLFCFRVQRLKNHWFYKPGHQKYSKSTGFTSRATKSVQKALVLHAGPPKVFNKQWFSLVFLGCGPGHRLINQFWGRPTNTR